MKVEFTEAEIKTMQTALEQWGEKSQIGCAVEECAELIVVLQKYANRNKTNMVGEILDEIADVEIMLAQIRLAVGIDDDMLRKKMEFKIERIHRRLSKEG